MAGPSGGRQHSRLRVRASDAEREDAVAQLRERFAAGQLSQDTFICRMETALGARTLDELAELLADLPAPRRLRMPAWRGLPARACLASRVRALFVPVRDALSSAASRVGSTRRRAGPPGLRFPAGSQLRFTIGRDPDCDLVIPDITVSRRHAGLDRGVRGWLLTDFGSTNGTRLNGWRIREPVPVAPGDRVTFGAVTFELQQGR